MRGSRPAVAHRERGMQHAACCGFADIDQQPSCAGGGPWAETGVDLALLAELQDDEAVAALADHVVGVARSSRPVHHEA